KYLLFRDKEPLEGDDDFFAEPAYFAEGWIEGVYLDDGLSGKQLCCFWVSPAGDSSEAINWRELAEVEVFEVSEDIYQEVKNKATLLEKAYDEAFKAAQDLITVDWFDFEFDINTREFICKTNPTIRVSCKLEI
ncbi:MAG: hypothetical protein ACI8Q1_003602, partial [Parvicella sp.]